MSGSFIENINAVADKLDLIETANATFDDSVIPVLTDIAELNLDDAIADLKKGNYLGNRKLDIDLALNVQGITQEIIDNDVLKGTNVARDIITTMGANVPRYSSASITFTDGDVIALPFLSSNGATSPITTTGGLLSQLNRVDIVHASAQVTKVKDIVPVNNTLYTLTLNGVEKAYVSDANTTVEDILTSFKQLFTNDAAVTVTIANNELIFTSNSPGVPFVLDVVPYMQVIESLYDRTIAAIKPANFVAYSVDIKINNVQETFTYVSGNNATTDEITSGLTALINNGGLPVTATTDTTNILLESVVFETPFSVKVNSNMLVETIADNVIGGTQPTAFTNKLNNTLVKLSSSVPSDILRVYDELGSSSNIEKITLTVLDGSYNSNNPVFYWGKTTSSFQVLSMRAGDIIKLGNELDNLIALSDNISKLLLLQDNLPQLVDTYIDGVPQGSLTIYNKLNELEELYSELTKLITLYSMRGDITTVADNITAVNNVSNELNQQSSNIRNVGENIGEIITVSDSISNVNNVGTNIAEVVNVSQHTSSINNTAAHIAEVITVDSNLADVVTVASNITSVINAQTNAALAQDGANRAEASATVADNAATLASASATIAASNADTSTTNANTAEAAANTAVLKSNEIKNVSVGNTLTGDPGTDAIVSYNNSSGEFLFVIPKGYKGDRGEAFTVDASGNLADRDNYDTALAGFSFLSLNENPTLVYFKASDATGDWTTGVPFGKGDKGDIGETGVGILSITPTSTTNPANSYNVGGFTDTYTITYTDNTTSTFDIYNGNGITSVELLSGDGSEGSITTYQINYTNGDTFTYPVYNGIDGNAITSVTRTAGNGAAGTEDTYTITFTKSASTTFKVYNGSDGGIESVNGMTGTVVITKATIGLDVVDNTADLDKPISTQTQSALDLKANTEVTYTKDEVDAAISGNVSWNYKNTSSDVVAEVKDFLLIDTTVKVAQVDLINIDVVASSATYEVTVDNLTYSYTSDSDATLVEIIDGLVDVMATDTVVTAVNDGGAALKLTAKIAGKSFLAIAGSNTSLTNSVPNKPGDIIVTLPATPSTNAKVGFLDIKSNLSTNPLSIARNGNTIMGVDEDMTVDTDNISFELIFTNNDWRVK